MSAKNIEHLIGNIRNSRGPANFDMQSADPDTGQSESEKIELITVQDIRREIPQVEGTAIILQRNAKDDRQDPESSDYGALVSAAAEKARLGAKEFFSEIFAGLGPEEIKSLDIMVVASDATLITEKGQTSPHKRAVETAEQVISGLQEAMAEHSVSDEQLLNNAASAHQGPIELSGLRDLRALEDSPEFIKFLQAKWGDKFWLAFEDDSERETRIAMGAEGPIEIANRVKYFLTVIANAMKVYHQENPGRRVIVWAVSHYDSISPYIKEHVAKMDTLKTYLPVEQGGGITITISPDGQVKTKIKDTDYSISL